jgi:hypothetical protein
LFEGEPTLVFHSRGAGRNNEYTPGLRVVFERLAAANVKIVRIIVDSGDTRSLPLAARTLALPDVPYPVEVASHDVAKLVGVIGRAAAAIGRKPGAKGSGNSTKRLRLWLDRSIDVGVLDRGTIRLGEPGK